MQRYAEVRRSKQRYAEVRRVAQRYAEVRSVAQRYTEVRSVTQRYAKLRRYSTHIIRGGPEIRRPGVGLMGGTQSYAVLHRDTQILIDGFIWIYWIDLFQPAALSAAPQGPRSGAQILSST